MKAIDLQAVADALIPQHLIKNEYEVLEGLVEHHTPMHLLKVLIETYESAVLEEPDLARRQALENMYWSLKHAMVELQSREGN